MIRAADGNPFECECWCDFPPEVSVEITSPPETTLLENKTGHTIPAGSLIYLDAYGKGYAVLPDGTHAEVELACAPCFPLSDWRIEFIDDCED